MHFLKKSVKENKLFKTMESEFNRKPVHFLRTKKNAFTTGGRSCLI